MRLTSNKNLIASTREGGHDLATLSCLTEIGIGNNPRLSQDVVESLSLPCRHRSELDVEPALELMTSNYSTRSQAVAIRQVNVKQHLRSPDCRHKALYKSSLAVQIEDSAIS